METKESKIKSLLRELEELRSDTTNEEEARKLRRQKADLENRLKEQAEEVDELTGQIQVLYRYLYLSRYLHIYINIYRCWSLPRSAWSGRWRSSTPSTRSSSR